MKRPSFITQRRPEQPRQKNSRSHRTSHTSLWMLIVLCMGLIFTPPGAARVAAQAPVGDWSEPVNISNAGASSSPAIVTDLDGITHVTWFDEFAGGRYAQMAADGVWSKAVSVRTPFTSNTPRLITSLDRYINAVWIDAISTLRLSRVPSKSAMVATSWLSPRFIASNVMSFDIYLDATNVFHMVYVTNTDRPNQPAGLYYIQGLMGGSSWGVNVPIYTSPYFRSLTVENAPHVSVTRLEKGAVEGEPGPIIIVWDDPSQGRILLTQSVDKGRTWGEAEVVDQADLASGSASPSSVDITTWNDELVMVWKKGTSTADCTMMFQTTTGNGASWTSPRQLFAETPGCPSETGFLGGDTEYLLWQATINNQVNLVAWNGSTWSDPQTQAELTGVTNPVTTQALSTGCLQLEYRPEKGQLNAIRCDTDGNQDIWYTSKPLEIDENWFAKESTWSAPEALTTTAKAIASLNVVSGDDGSIYSMWTEPSQSVGVTGDSFDMVMFSVWDGETWSAPTSSFRPRGGGAYEMAVTHNSGGDLLATWRGESPGQVFFSRVEASRAFSALEWAEAVELPVPAGPCITPAILAGPGEEVYVAYAVPANEGRGIYLNYSLDKGRTWSDPVRLFDAQAAGWEVAEKPVLQRTADGKIHALWQRGSMLMRAYGVGLGYASSADGGVTWNQADLSIEARVRWAGLISPDQGTLFRAWLEFVDGVPAVLSQASTDGGTTWKSPESITISGEILGNPSLITDPTGRIHLLQLNRNLTGDIVINHWIWYNNDWTAGESLYIEQAGGLPSGVISANISSQEKLVIFYVTKDHLTGGETLQVVSSAAEQAGEAVEAPQPTTAAPTPTQPAEPAAEIGTAEPAAASASPTPGLTETTAPLLTPTPTADLSGGGAPTSSDETWTGLILGSVLGVVIVSVFFGYRIVQSRKRVYR